MSSVWIFTLVALAIVLALGSTAFFIGYRNGLKNGPLEAVPRAREPKPQSVPPTSSGLVRQRNSRILSQAPDEKAVLVEFMDLASEACRAAQPFIEDLKQEFGHNVTFIGRYFPRTGQLNSEAAALAVEAAGKQDKFDEMLTVVFETQPHWAEASDSKAGLFRKFAEELELDMTKFDNALTDICISGRIEDDKTDGTALGVGNTPTFFLLDGQKIEAESLDHFRQLISAAAKGK